MAIINQTPATSTIGHSALQINKNITKNQPKVLIFRDNKKFRMLNSEFFTTLFGQLALIFCPMYAKIYFINFKKRILMYKIIFVDPDQAVIDTICNIFDWKEMGIEPVGMFSNVPDAIEFLKSNKVDAILTEVNIPEFSGIDLARYVNKSHLDTIVAFMSKFASFEYAQQGILEGVCDYLLKPITFNSLRNTCYRILARLNTLHKSLNKDEIIVTGTFSQIISDYLVNSVKEPINLQSLLSLNNINIDIHNTPAAVVKITIPNITQYLTNTWKYGKNALYDAILKQFPHGAPITVVPGFYFFDSMKCVIFGTKDCSLPDFKKMLSGVLASLTETCKSIMHLNITTNIIVAKHNITLINKVRISRSVEKNKIDSLISRIKLGDKYESIDYYNSLIANQDFDFIKNLSKSIKTAIKEDLLGKNLEDIEVNTRYMNSLTDKNAYINYSKKMITRATEHFAGMFARNYDPLISAKEYVQLHYAEDISLIEVANHVSLSPSYFSKRFKKDNNINFIDYLINVRIQRAKVLLISSRYKVNEICKMCGFNSLNHFYKTFKEITGYTAQQYRTMHKNEVKE